MKPKINIDSIDWMTSLPKNPFGIARTWLLIGSAGAGKSRCLESTIDDLLKMGVKSTEIMYILFNKKPADEFKERYYAKGFTDEDMPWWGTHHAIMRRLKKIPATNIVDGKKLKELGERYKMPFSEVEDADSYEAKNDWDNALQSLQAKIYKCDSNYTILERKILENLKDAEVTSGLWTHFRYLADGCEKELFPSEVRFVFIDEAQDNGKIQLNWLESVLENTSIEGMMLAGDDKQAINVFKGSDPLLFLSFPVDRHVALRKSYRCTRKVLDTANNIIKATKNRSPLSNITNKTNTGDVYFGSSMTSEAQLIMEKIRAGEDILALVRNNYLKQYVRRTAMELGIPIKSPVFDRLLETVGAIKHIHDTGLITIEDYAAILPGRKNNYGGLNLAAYWNPGDLPMLRKAEFDGTPYENAYLEMLYDDGLPLNRATELLFSPDFIEDVSKMDIPMEKWTMPKADMIAFKRMVGWANKGYGQMTVSTIHAAKGLEEGTVILFRDVATKTKTAEYLNQAEEQRVWYVGATRAKDTLIILQAHFGGRMTNLV